MSDILVRVLIALATPLTVELYAVLSSLIASLLRRGIDPPWAVGVAIETLRQIAANPLDDTDAGLMRRTKDAIAEQIRDRGVAPTEQDVAQLYGLARDRIRADMGLSRLPAPTAAPNV